MTATDHETTVLDDLDFAVPCDGEDCEQTATLAVTVRGLPCCVKSILSCADCLEWNRSLLRHHDWMTCERHGGTAPTAQCHFDARPLNPR